LVTIYVLIIRNVFDVLLWCNGIWLSLWADQPSLSSPRELMGNTISVFGTASSSDTLDIKCQMGLL